MPNIYLAEPNLLQSYLDKREKVNADEHVEMKSIFDRQDASELFSIDGDTATIKIVGVLTQDGPDWIDNFFGMSVTGYNQLIEAIGAIKSDDAIKNVNLQMDTPGGEASGCDLVFQAIEDLAKSKNVVAVNNGMIASAGYWLALGANEIVATSPGNETGSIGVIIAGFDFIGYYEEAFGLKFVKIKSQNAPNKAPGISTKEDIKLLQDRINALERIFLERVSSSRGKDLKTVKETFGKGGVLVAQDPDSKMPDAISVGMIDKLISGSLENNKTNNKTKTKTQIKSKYLKEDKMDFTQLLADTPGLQEHIDKLKSEAYQSGVDATKKETDARTAKASPILESDEYPGPIKKLALKVINGESGPDALDAAVTSFEISVEEKKEAEARAEAEKETPASAPESAEDGAIKTEEALEDNAKAITGNAVPKKDGE